MVRLAPPNLDHPLGHDVAAVNRQLDEALPGWRDVFGDDLPEGLDLRPTIARMRALLLMVQVKAAAGDLGLTGMSPAQSVSTMCQWIRGQLYDPELRPSGRVDVPPPRRGPADRAR
jgi:hypothetical protein